MDTTVYIQIIVFILCLFLSAFFSSSETSLMGANKMRMKKLAEEGNKNAQTYLYLVDNSTILLSTILIGNNLVNIGASSIATSLAITFFEDKGVGIATGLVTLLVLVFGEITPKSLARNNSDNLALKLSRPIYILSKILRPIIAILNVITGALIHLLGGNKDSTQDLITQDDLRTMIKVSQEQGEILDSEKDMIDNVFEIKASQVKDIMTPRTDIIAIDSEMTYEEIKDLFNNNEFSRLPVYYDNIDSIKGIIHIRDLISKDIDIDHFNILDYVREPFFVYEYHNVSKLFKSLREEKTHMAIVLDEYGGTAGLITIEDILEELVGEIEDEYDIENIDIQIVGPNEAIIEGSTKIELVNEMFNSKIEDDSYESIGGVVFGKLGRMPEIGDKVQIDNMNFEIMSMDYNRIEYLRLTRDE